MGLSKSILLGLARLLGVDLLALVDEIVEPDELLETAADRDDVDVDDLIAFAADHAGDVDVERSDELLEQLALELGRDPIDVFWRPLETITELDDSPEKTYIWILREGVDRHLFADRIHEMYTEAFGREPRSMHIPVNDVDDLRLADPYELRTYVQPHIERAEKTIDVERSAGVI